MNKVHKVKEDYLRKLTILNNAAVSVILTRTREPYRAEEAIRHWCYANGDKCVHSWSCVTGWQKYMHDSDTVSGVDQKTMDLLKALKNIADVDNGGKEPMQGNIFIIQYPHWIMGKHPQIVQVLKMYARQLPETDQRIILIVPEGVTLPTELENDIAVLDFHLPHYSELRECFDNIMDSVSEDKFNFTEEEISTLISSGGGMTESEFESALSRALIESSKSKDTSFDAINKILLDAKTEVIKRSEVLELIQPVSMNDVGGLELAKQWIKKRKTCFSQEARDFGIDKPKGILGIGPSGTGKSLFAKAIANTLGLPLVRFDIGRVFGSLVGQSEERVRSALKQIDALAPCCVYIDEVDKAGIDPRQSGGDGGTSKRIIGNILTHMQDSEASVFWILTANRVDSLPPELLRKGRLDEIFAILPPDSKEREEIVKIHLRKRKQNPNSIHNLKSVVDASEGFVGAEIESAVNSAIIEAFSDSVEVTAELIVKELESMKPMSVAFKDDFDAMYRWASDNARPSSIPDNYSTQSTEIKPRRRIRTQNN